MMIIAFITWNTNLAPLIEGPYACSVKLKSVWIRVLGFWRNLCAKVFLKCWDCNWTGLLQVLDKDDQILGIDPEFTRPGILQMLQDFKNGVEAIDPAIKFKY